MSPTITVVVSTQEGTASILSRLADEMAEIHVWTIHIAIGIVI